MSKKIIISLLITFSFFIQINKCTELEFQSKLRDKRFLRTLTEKLGKSDALNEKPLSKREKTVDKDIENLGEVKKLLLKMLDKLDTFGELSKEKTGTNFKHQRKRSKKNRKLRQPRQRWGNWTEWSSCSVTCGKGREIRWRHCLDSCEDAETEMEEKTCQLPACPPGKLFGIFKL